MNEWMDGWDGNPDRPERGLPDILTMSTGLAQGLPVPVLAHMPPTHLHAAVARYRGVALVELECRLACVCVWCHRLVVCAMPCVFATLCRPCVHQDAGGPV